MIASKVIKILDLVDPNNPVLTRERFLDCREFRALVWKTGATDSVLSLAGWEEGIEVVVG